MKSTLVLWESKIKIQKAKTKKKWYQCDFCNKSFECQSTLKIQRKVHTIVINAIVNMYSIGNLITTKENIFLFMVSALQKWSHILDWECNM